MDHFQQREAAQQPVDAYMVGAPVAGRLGPATDFGPPFVTAAAHPISPYAGSAWQLSSGIVVVRIGCQTRLLTDWETNAEQYAGPAPEPTPDPHLQRQVMDWGRQRETDLALLRAFLNLVRAAAPEPIPEG